MVMMHEKKIVLHLYVKNRARNTSGAAFFVEKRRGSVVVVVAAAAAAPKRQVCIKVELLCTRAHARSEQ